MTQFTSNLCSALDWIGGVVAARLNVHFGVSATFEPAPLTYRDDDSWLGRFLRAQKPELEELAILLLVLSSHLRPNLFGKLLAAHLPDGGDFPEFGGVKGVNHRGFLPTGETAQFVLAGEDLESRLVVQRILSTEHWFARQRILWLEPVREGEPAMSGRLVLDPEIVEQITLGKLSRPRFSMDFPAEYLETAMDWEDLVLNAGTLRQIREIERWIAHNDTLLRDFGMRKRIKPGYRALFHGPPGTGKTLAATLLGKHAGKDAFRIDLSRVVSKYIGETEKNLSRLFDKAEHKDWILFFDEAEALFGKRTDIRDAHDKYANQETAYLLQRIEAYNGLVILATNQRANIDEAFIRRFQTVAHFPMPRPDERQALWQKTFPAQIPLAGDIDWRQVAQRYELTGAGILNVAHFCALEILAEQSPHLDLRRLEAAILREYAKEGKII